ncbi:MAG: hypothetical protein K6E51_08215 [Treponema sp.]|nr:hypothetical protein [Treponema sp.]
MKWNRLVLFCLIVWCICHVVTAQMSHHANGESMPYHGMRMLRTAEAFYITSVTTTVPEDGVLQFDIEFNVPCNPRSIDISAFTVDGKSLPPDTTFKFNKAGTILRFAIPYTAGKTTQLTLDVPQIQSFNGRILYRRHFSNLMCSHMHQFLLEK